MEFKIELGPLTKLGWMLLSILLWPLNMLAWIYDAATTDSESVEMFRGVSAIIGWAFGGILGFVFLLIWADTGIVWPLLLTAWGFIGYGFYSGRKTDWENL